MPKRNTDSRDQLPRHKDSYHIYSLQKLSPAKFEQVVGKILCRRYLMVTDREAGKS